MTLDRCPLSIFCSRGSGFWRRWAATIPQGMGVAVQGVGVRGFMGNSLTRNSAPVGPYSRAMARALWWS